MSTKRKTFLLALVAAGLVGYSNSPEPSFFSITTHVAGWMGMVGLFWLVMVPGDDKA